jgi:hypothetical protein
MSFCILRIYEAKIHIEKQEAGELVIFKAMKNRLRNAIAIAILPQIALVLWFRQHPGFIETWYSKGVYLHISAFFRRLYGWIPFSVGDCLYALLLIYAIWYLVRNRRKIRLKPLEFLRNATMVLSVGYFTFHLMWGLNYYRERLYISLDLEEGYSQEELRALTEQLVARTNELQLELTGDTLLPVEVPYNREGILLKTLEGYERLGGKYPSLRYGHPSIKKSLFSTLLTYMGYGGYLNPFTNEAQVNRKIPLFRYPVICGHEIGHQLGYSAENETNFIGYLVTASNEDPYFRYAAYAYAASYCLSEINVRDPVASKRIYAGFHKGVQRNFMELEEFWKGYENPMEPLFKNIFNTFLRANNQMEGIRSYNRIVTLLVTYHKKHPL